MLPQSHRLEVCWKYALSLELTDSGFDHTVLSEFRSRLLSSEAAGLLLDTLLARVRERGVLKARGRQRTDSTHMLAVVRAHEPGRAGGGDATGGAE